ncbi:MAG: ATP-binding cassette domain-containing protein [Sphaerochaetaceae bacterium]|jgi:ATP-binding cassette subfamily F protein 3
MALHVQHITFSYGDRRLLHDVSFTLPKGSRCALAGENGSGKTTLLHIIQGSITPDSGAIVYPPYSRVGYLPQSGIFHSGTTLFEEVEKAFDRFLPLVEEQRTLEEQLSNLSSGDNYSHMSEQLHGIHETLLESNFHNKEAIISPILTGLGFKASDYTRQTEEFSGGWHMRIALAKLLVEDPDILLLDEPTNYLDVDALYWLKEYLAFFKGSVLIVSHDQDFLDESVNEVLELFRGSLKRYKGNYSLYVQQREMEIALLEKQYKEQQKEIEKTEAFIERFRYKATKARQVQSREKQLSKIERIELPSYIRPPSFSFPSAPSSGQDVLTIRNLSKSYGDLHLFNNFSFDVKKGDRLAVTGRNGAGKSTLLRMLAHTDTVYDGEIIYGSHLKVGYFDQDTEHTLTPQNTLLEEVESVATTADIPRLRNLLGSFLFTGDDIDKKVSVLSGGERSRLALLKILLHPVNLLILDEPTNHLDIGSIHTLLNALEHYSGSLVFVSHNTHFIKHVANRILYLSDQSPEFFEGDYTYFQWKLDQKYHQGTDIQQDLSTIKEASSNERWWKESNRLKNRLKRIESESSTLTTQISEVEHQLDTMNHVMALEENYKDSEKIRSLIDQKEALEKSKEELEHSWFTLIEESEELQQQLDEYEQI